jgi:hypothetical protein
VIWKMNFIIVAVVCVVFVCCKEVSLMFTIDIAMPSK